MDTVTLHVGGCSRSPASVGNPDTSTPRRLSTAHAPHPEPSDSDGGVKCVVMVISGPRFPHHRVPLSGSVRLAPPDSPGVTSRGVFVARKEEVQPPMSDRTVSKPSNSNTLHKHMYFLHKTSLSNSTGTQWWQHRRRPVSAVQRTSLACYQECRRCGPTSGRAAASAGCFRSAACTTLPSRGDRQGVAKRTGGGYAADAGHTGEGRVAGLTEWGWAPARRLSAP